tara:strand:- start:122 stop:325 length:204 start_codon:yes stop_codon:yes gene_type:complete
MDKFEYKVIDIDKICISEEKLLNRMNSDGWELFFIHNEPQNEYPSILVKFYFRRKKLSFLEQFFDFT